MNNIFANMDYADFIAGLFALLILLFVLLSLFFGHTVDPQWVSIFLLLLGFLGIKQIPSAAQNNQINAALARPTALLPIGTTLQSVTPQSVTPDVTHQKIISDPGDQTVP